MIAGSPPRQRPPADPDRRAAMPKEIACVRATLALHVRDHDPCHHWTPHHVGRRIRARALTHGCPIAFCMSSDADLGGRGAASATSPCQKPAMELPDFARTREAVVVAIVVHHRRQQMHGDAPTVSNLTAARISMA